MGLATASSPLLSPMSYFFSGSTAGKEEAERRSALYCIRGEERRGIADKWSISGISVTHCLWRKCKFFVHDHVGQNLLHSIRLKRPTGGVKIPELSSDHREHPFLPWPPLRKIPLLARKFHTALTLPKEKRREGAMSPFTACLREIVNEVSYSMSESVTIVLNKPITYF